MPLTWDQIIGQTEAKSVLDFHFNGWKAGQPMPSLFFVGPRGFGKTVLGTALGLRMTEETRGAKKFFLINSATVKNEKQLVESILINLCQDKECTLMFDEAHTLSDKVVGALLTVIQPNKEHRNTYTYGDYNVDIDLNKNSFFFCTTEAHKIFMPLMNRTKRISLTDYNYGDLSKIIQQNAPDVRFKDGTLLTLASVCRGTARQAVMMGDDVCTYLAPLYRKEFTNNDWDKLRKKLSIYPLGLSGLEIQALRILSQSRDASLTRLSATMNMSPESVRRDVELHLLRNNLLEISRGSGRNITPMGSQYLKALASW